MKFRKWIRNKTPKRHAYTKTRTIKYNSIKNETKQNCDKRLLEKGRKQNMQAM